MDAGFKPAIVELEKFQNSIFPILTVYLSSVAKAAPSAKLLLSGFHSLISHSLSAEEQKLFKKDLSRIEVYLREIYDKRGKRTVVFFSAGKKLWEILDFEFYLPPLCLVSYSPYIGPVTEALQAYKKYLVLLVDREKARLFTVHLGKIGEQKEIFDGEVPQNVKHGDDTWDAQDKIFRHIEDHLSCHLKRIAGAAEEFVKNNEISFVIIGGHREMFPKIKKHLPYPLNKMVIGEFVTELNIPLNEILKKSKLVAEKLEG